MTAACRGGRSRPFLVPSLKERLCANFHPMIELRPVRVMARRATRCSHQMQYRQLTQRSARGDLLQGCLDGESRRVVKSAHLSGLRWSKK